MSPDERTKLLEQLEAIRAEGKVNPLSRFDVQHQADRHGFHELVLFIQDTLEDHRGGLATYAELLREMGDRRGRAG